MVFVHNLDLLSVANKLFIQFYHKQLGLYWQLCMILHFCQLFHRC
ncbi:MAG: hypothetical protein PARBB_01980 [Parabacteroides distasonis]